MKKLLLVIPFLLLPFTVFAQPLTDEERAILAHVVIDPDAWAAHALVTDPGGKALAAKIAKYRDDYLTKKDLPEYKTRAERDEAAKPTAGQILAMERETLIAAELRKQAIDKLIADGTLTSSGELK